MTYSKYYSIPVQTVVFEILENEAIVIQQKTGVYYSMRESAAFIWSLIAQAEAENDIILKLSDYYSRERDVIRADLKTFLNSLTDEELIIPSSQKPDVRSYPGNESQTVFSDKYTPPALDRYDDMQAYISVDPIHDTSSEDWPGSPE